MDRRPRVVVGCGVGAVRAPAAPRNSASAGVGGLPDSVVLIAQRGRRHREQHRPQNAIAAQTAAKSCSRKLCWSRPRATRESAIRGNVHFPFPSRELPQTIDTLLRILVTSCLGCARIGSRRGRRDFSRCLQTEPNSCFCFHIDYQIALADC